MNKSKIAIVLSILLVHIDSNAIKKVDFEPTLESLNVLTFSPVQKSIAQIDQSINEYTIDTLVFSINQGNMPTTGIVTMPENSATPYLQMHKGIVLDPDEEWVVVFSRGYARTNTFGSNENFLQQGGCAVAAYWPFRDGMIAHIPCVTFDYPDARKYFNVGQSTDLACFELVVSEVHKAAPRAHIIFMGDCRGAKVIFNYLCSYCTTTCAKDKNNHYVEPRAVIVLAPFVSFRDLCKQIAKTKLRFSPAGNFLHTVLSWNMPNYDESEEKDYCDLATIKNHIPFFIGHRIKDALISDRQIISIISELRKSGNRDVHFMAVYDQTATHSKLTTNTDMQHAVNKFFKQYGIPYHAHYV